MTAMFKFKQSTELCPIHNVNFLVVAGNQKICPECANQKLEQSRKDDAAEQAKKWLDLRTKQAFFPKRHTECTLKNYMVSHPKQQFALETCVNMAKSLEQGTSKNLMLVGNTGTGKTHLSCGIGRFLLKKHKSVRYITSAEIAERVMSSWGRKDQTETSVLDEFAGFDLLIIDEIGLHDSLMNEKSKTINDLKREAVHKLLYKRYDDEKSTILISNLDCSTLKNWMGDRLWSRYHDGGSPLVECIWADYRMGGAV